MILGCNCRKDSKSPWRLSSKNTGPTYCGSQEARKCLKHSQRGKGEKTSFLSQACSEYTAAGRHPGSKTKLDKALEASKRT